MSASWSAAPAPILLLALACADTAVEVDAALAVPRDIESALTTNGRIEATGRVAVHAEAGGSVERILVERGHQVQQGQELVRLADTGQAAALAQAEARLAAARARLAVLESGLPPARRAALKAERSRLAQAAEGASDDLGRLERLVERDAAPRVELEAARRVVAEHAISIEALDAQLGAPLAEGQREESEAAVREAESALSAAREALAGLAVRAPGPGVVYSLPVARGDHLDGGSLVARLGFLDAVRARIFVDEPDLGRIQSGCPAVISADAYPGREWNCRVDRLATEVVELGARRVGEVQCTVANPDGSLLPNLAVGIRIVTDSVRGAPSIPRLAVRRRGGRTYVWTVEGSRAVRREIVTGVEGPAHVEVRSGLGETEPVLLPRDETLAEGARVKVRLRKDDDA